MGLNDISPCFTRAKRTIAAPSLNHSAGRQRLHPKPCGALDPSPRMRASTAQMSSYRAREYLVPAALGPRPTMSEDAFQFADFIRLLEARSRLIFRVALGTILLAL